MIFPDDDNSQALKNMADQGDDLSQARDINFSLVFGDLEGAKSFQDISLTHRWPSKIENSNNLEARDKFIEVTVTLNMIPSHENITKIEKELEYFANKFGGKGDGWGCFSVTI